MSAALLEVAGVDAHHGQLQALFGVDLAVDEGDTVAMIGANGAGKSTLLHTIAGALRPTRGTVTFAGASLAGVAADRRVGLGIALVPEGRRLFPSLTVEENLLVGAHRRRRGAWNVARVVELFPWLDRLRNRRAAYLSGGEQQAVAIGRALMANPRLLLLDEVSLGLAPAVVKQVYAALPGIVAEGATVIVVEQDIGQALAVARHVTCLLEGRVSLQGRPAELTRDRIMAAYFGM
ncbi:MAG TPA: ABC transporter ATP-binding protein [Acidimicrobiales bacterium]|nr:ABC transporter ATP-binding protein [Acidimicrobiales bacterium]